jgi:hypothetical protein
MYQQLSLTTRRVFAGLLAAAGVAYGALIVATYANTTAPSSLGPDLVELKRLLFSAAKPAGAMERRLEASDTPLGTGPLISGGSAGSVSMRFAFAGQSDERTTPLNAKELAEREGERLALLDWIRSGASQVAYEDDDYTLVNLGADIPVTGELLVTDASTANAAAPHRVRIRSLINERCVTCHNEEGDDTARLVPFDTYASIALYLVPETNANGGRAWLLATLVSLYPLAALLGSAFSFTRHPLAMRLGFLTATIAALLILTTCWLAGPFLAPVLFAAAGFAVFCIMVQLLATIEGLLGGPKGDAVSVHRNSLGLQKAEPC